MLGQAVVVHQCSACEQVGLCNILFSSLQETVAKWVGSFLLMADFLGESVFRAWLFPSPLCPSIHVPFISSKGRGNGEGESH